MFCFSAVFSSPILYFYYTAEVPGYGNQCWITFDEPWQWQVYMTLVSMTLFVIPAILIAACYIIIVCTIWNKGKELSVCNLLSSVETNAVLIKFVNQHPNKQ
jgi:neuropeptide S receptor 1